MKDIFLPLFIVILFIAFSPILFPLLLVDLAIERARARRCPEELDGHMDMPSESRTRLGVIREAR